MPNLKNGGEIKVKIDRNFEFENSSKFYLITGCLYFFIIYKFR